MDPVACLDFINDKQESNSARCERIKELANWFASGGFAPGFDALTTDSMIMAESEGCRLLAAAVQNVCVNGDLSGLQGLGYVVSH